MTVRSTAPYVYVKGLPEIVLNRRKKVTFALKGEGRDEGEVCRVRFTGRTTFPLDSNPTP